VVEGNRPGRNSQVVSMAEHIDIRAGSEPSTPSGRPRFTDLDSETQGSSFKALAAAAFVYSSVYLVAFTTSWLTWMAANGHFQPPTLFDSVVALAAIGYALSVGLRCRRGRCSSVAFTRVAIAFLVVTSFGISAQLWSWESDFPKSAFVFGVSWLGVWIAMYATIVTLPPRHILFASLLAWLTLPVVATVSVIVHGKPAEFEGPPWLAIARVSIPVLICVGIAYYCAFRVFRLARAVTKARRLGSYRLSQKLGAGGMGEVWSAQHRMLRRPAAIKLIRPEALGVGEKNAGRTALQRFEREAQATAMLTSPHSIVLYDFGIDTEGLFYYVMELLEGRDLRTLVQTHGPLPAERAVHFLRAACDSLADAHHRGLIHRDVKPANLFTCRRGREFDVLKILDFGLVKNTRDTGDTLTELTGAGVTSGTPGFMAPEAVTGEWPVDARTDLYGLGCVAYWMLTGQLVFEGKSPMAILVQHVKEEPPAMRARTELEIPARLEAVVRACLAKHPAERPASADDLGRELAAVAAGLPAWTQSHAAAWWQTHLPDLYAAAVHGRVDAAEPMVIDS
jgi:eukaryotic-like serine/threonine-protein kinase